MKLYTLPISVCELTNTMAKAIGRSNQRLDVFEPLRLDPYDTSAALASGPARNDPNTKLCLPKGFELVAPERNLALSQLRLKLSNFYTAQHRRIFGYVADIIRIDSANTNSPLMLTVVVKLPFVYWSTVDQPTSWTYARIIAFSSDAASTVSAPVVIGDPISGIAIDANSKYKTAKLIGWSRKCDPLEILPQH